LSDPIYYSFAAANESAMALKTFVKISEVNNLSDARYCAGMGVNLMGFQLDQDAKHYASPENFAEITGWLAGVEFVAEYENTSADYIKKAIVDYELDYIQVSNAELIDSLAQQSLPLILKITIEEAGSVEAVSNLMKTFSDQVAYFLLESNSEVVYKAHIMQEIYTLAKTHPILLGFQVSDENVLDLVDNTALKGISLKGGEEIRPGYKDFDQLADILETLEVED
jgi:phosphoribosylanthranilate isomerase